MKTIFMSDRGLRAGWRLAMFVVLLLAAAVCAAGCAAAIARGALHRSLHAAANTAMRADPPPLVLALGEGVALAAVLAAAAIMARIEHRPTGVYGLPVSAALRGQFWEGAAIGCTSLGVVLAVLAVVGDFRITGVHETGGVLVRDGFAWALTFVLVALTEEFAFRGYPQFTLTTAFDFRIAAVLTSAAFGAAHGINPGETPIGLENVIALALFFCFTLWRTGTLWFAVGYHAAWDWCQTYLFGTPDSGMLTSHAFFTSAISGAGSLSGSTAGPEGSVLTFVVLGLATGYVRYRFPGRRYSVAVAPSAGKNSDDAEKRALN
jgi:membrane protease YdiL (CAAX protease family)